MRTLSFSCAALAVAALAGCAQTQLGSPRAEARKPFPCHGDTVSECGLDVNPNGQWVPVQIVAKKNPSSGKYPDIRWKLDPQSPFKFIGQGIYFEGDGARYFQCDVTGNRKQVRCKNDAPQTPESGQYRYRVQIELDPFVWNN